MRTVTKPTVSLGNDSPAGTGTAKNFFRKVELRIVGFFIRLCGTILPMMLKTVS